MPLSEELLPARVIDAAGRCCGRKPLSYKRPSPYLFCTRCCAEFLPDGRQVQNWAYKYEGGHFRPTYPEQEPYRSFLAALSANEQVEGEGSREAKDR